MSKNERNRLAKSRLLSKRSLNSMKKPKFLDPRANSFMTKTLKNIGKDLPQMDYTCHNVRYQMCARHFDAPPIAFHALKGIATNCMFMYKRQKRGRLGQI